MEPEPDLFTILGCPADRAEPAKPPSARLPVTPATPTGTATPPPHQGTRLRAFLSGCYGHATPRGSRKPVTNNQPIRIDDRGPQDVSPAFCDVFATVPDNRDGLFLLELHRPPRNPEVDELVKAKGGRIRQSTTNPSWAPIRFFIPVRPKDTPFLRKLARAVRRVTAKGRSYDDPNWKWLTPRTADSIDRLARHLDDFRKSTKRTQGADKRTAHQ